MNVFNRIFMILLAAATVVAAGIVVVVQFRLVDPYVFGYPLSVPLSSMAAWEFGERLSSIGITAAVALLAALLLVLELRPGNRAVRHFVVSESPEGRVEVSQRSVQALASRASREVPGVVDADSHVDEDATGLRIRAVLDVDSSVPLVELSRMAQQRIKEAVESQIGRTVSEVRIDTQVQQLAARRVR